jgi:hypothetical protein
MMQLVVKLKEVNIDKLSNLSLEHLHTGEARTHNFQFLGFNDCCDDSLFENEMNESKDNVDYNPKRILPLEANQIEKLNNHGMKHVLDEEVLMQIFNLAM